MHWLIILLLVLLLVLLVLLVGMKLRASLSHAGVRHKDPLPALNNVFPDGISVRPRMLLYFYSEHCAACRVVTPLVEALHRRDEGVVKLDVRRHLLTARHFGIKSTPSLVLLEHGRIAGVHVGTINQLNLQQFYEGRNMH